MSADVFGKAWGWSWQDRVDGTDVCTGMHSKHDPCQYRPATEEEKRLHTEIKEYKRSTMLRKEGFNAQTSTEDRA